MRTFEDEQGKQWAADRIGRTSGIVSSGGGEKSFPEPADIVRFTCKSDPDEPDRETTMKAGIISTSSVEDLRSSLGAARIVRRH
ncbi:MAG: hypothetical protein O7I93_05060 [Gemmatimonadetes bacterium]|nr:hypothetical protein [Gemmatimonadota bacterium]